MTPKRLQIDPLALDARLLWSETQQALHAIFQKLVGKCEQVKGTRGCVLVTTGEVPEHWIAAFNLAMAHSFSAPTMLVDATNKTHVQNDLLEVQLSSDRTVSLVSPQFMLMSMSPEVLFATQWPSSVNGLVGEHMFAIVQTRDAFKLDWTSSTDEIVVIALAAPTELEEERWLRLAELVGSERFLGLWVID